MIDLKQFTGPELVAHYNAAAATLELDPVKRFSDRATAEKRVRFIMSMITDRTQRPGPFREEPGPMKGSVRAEDAPHPKIKVITSVSGPALERLRQVEARVKPSIEVPPAKDQTPTPAVKPTLPIASDNPAKDAEMPALRRVVRLVELRPKSPIHPRKAGSKQAVLVDALSRPQGATFGELYDALAADGRPWRCVTIRSGLAWDMNGIAGYGIASSAHTGEEFAAMGRAYEAARLGMEQGRDGHWRPGPAYDPALRLLVYRLSYPAGMNGPLPHTVRKAAEPRKGGA
jgi:hypothetical protein